MKKRLRRWLKKSSTLEKYALDLKRQARLEQSRLGGVLSSAATRIAGDAPVLSEVLGQIGDTDAMLTWHYTGWPQKGFDVEISTPESRTFHVREPRIRFEHLTPGETYRGQIRSLDNPYAAIPFGFWTRSPYTTGYALPLSLLAGETVELFISSHTEDVRVKLVSLLDRTQVWGEWTVCAKFQYAPYDASARGCGWKRDLSVMLPSDMPSGVYVFDIQSQDTGPCYSTPIIVRPEVPPELAVVCSTDTWNAYNNWGGNSFYDNFIGAPEPLWATHERPAYLSDPWSTGAYHMGAEAHVLRHLARHGFKFGVYGDEDLAAGRITSCKTLVLMGHNEYWCDDKVAEFDRLQAAGVNVLVLSGNTLYRRIIRDPSRRASSRFAIFPDREVCRRIGTIYTAAGRETGAPFEVTLPEHWIYEGCDVQAGSVFGSHENPLLSASGLETDKRTEYSPGDAEVIARGMNAVGGAEWVVFRHEGGGLVVNAGSMTVTLHMADRVIDRMMLNVLQRLGHTPQLTV